MNQSEVWTELALHYMKMEKFAEASGAFIAGKNPGYYEEMIALNKKVHEYAKMLEYLKMARAKKKEMAIDNHFIYCLAKLGKLPEIE